MILKYIIICITLQASLSSANPNSHNARTSGGFIEGTKIQMNHLDEFEDIDRLMSFWYISGADDNSLKEKEQQIKQTYSHYVEKTYKFEFVGSDEPLIVAGDQYLAVYTHIQSKFEWKKTKEIDADHLVLAKNQHALQIQSIQILDQKTLVHNIELKEGHVFFVGEKNQVIAHNAVMIPIFTWVIGESIILPTLAAAATIAHGVVTAERIKQEIYGKHNGSKYDLYKDRTGDLYVKPKGGRGPGEPTGYNIHDL
ncbi:MAG: polymorphic toxin type 33 domain-containing protein [Oligoflexales bacterium]